MIYEFAHKWEDVRIVCGRGENKSSVTESVFDRLGHIITRKVGNGDFRTSRIVELLCKQLNGGLCVTVNRSVRNNDAFALCSV